MRLTCPNCEAQYEVDDSVIPPEGRDVQCSNCGHTWFQQADGAEDAAFWEPEAEPDGPGPETAEPPETTPEARRRPLDETVLSVLREEAEFEQRAREAEALEDQPDLGLDAPPAPQDTSHEERMARLRGLETGTAEDLGTRREATARRDLLPDIEEINSTLDPMHYPLADMDDFASAADRDRGNGFRRGFALVLILAGIALSLYAYAAQIAAAVPALEPALGLYAGTIDNWRLWLNTQVPLGLERLTEIVTNATP